MSNFNNFQFIATVISISATILGAIAIILNAFVKTRTKRRECIEQFERIEERIDNEEEAMNKQKTSEAVAKQKFEFIERELREIRDKQNEMNNKIDRIFEIMMKIPKRIHNGKEE